MIWYDCSSHCTIRNSHRWDSLPQYIRLANVPNSIRDSLSPVTATWCCRICHSAPLICTHNWCKSIGYFGLRERDEVFVFVPVHSTPTLGPDHDLDAQAIDMTSNCACSNRHSDGSVSSENDCDAVRVESLVTLSHCPAWRCRVVRLRHPHHCTRIAVSRVCAPLNELVASDWWTHRIRICWNPIAWRWMVVAVASAFVLQALRPVRRTNSRSVGIHVNWQIGLDAAYEMNGGRWTYLLGANGLLFQRCQHDMHQFMCIMFGGWDHPAQCLQGTQHSAWWVWIRSQCRMSAIDHCNSNIHVKLYVIHTNRANRQSPSSVVNNDPIRLLRSDAPCSCNQAMNCGHAANACNNVFMKHVRPKLCSPAICPRRWRKREAPTKTPTQHIIIQYQILCQV